MPLTSSVKAEALVICQSSQSSQQSQQILEVNLLRLLGRLCKAQNIKKKARATF